jgi:hypothetical protein
MPWKVRMGVGDLDDYIIVLENAPEEWGDAGDSFEATIVWAGQPDVRGQIPVMVEHEGKRCVGKLVPKQVVPEA